MDTLCAWPCPATHPVLLSSEVHLWFADLAQPTAVAQALGGLLSSTERARAARFRFERDRRRYVVSHGVLRRLLGRYLGLSGHDLAFRYGEWGKPALMDDQNRGDLQFSLSHSGDGVVYALTTKCRVGVDLERIRPIPEANDIVNRFFSPEESRGYHSLSGSQREQAFFRFWTRREAFLKALGYGLTGASPAGDVIIGDGGAVQVCAGRDGQPASGWRLHSFSPVHGFVSAVAMESHQGEFKYYYHRVETATPESDVAEHGYLP